MKFSRLFPTALAVAVLASTAWFTRAQPTPAAAARKSFQPLALPAELPSASGYSTLDAWPGIRFRQPLCIATPPGETDRVFIVNKTGEIEVVSDLSLAPKKSLVINLATYLQSKNWTLAQQVEWGALAIAFHPRFAENHYCYIAYDFTIADDGGRRRSFDRLSRFTFSNASEIDPASELPLITQYDEASNHNGSDLHFGDDGYLYYSIGDEGNANDSFDNARWIDKDFFAAIFRIDVDRQPANLEPNPHTQESTAFPSAVNVVEGHAAYKVPADNPFVGATTHHAAPVDPKKVRTEIWATGLRNAWRYSFDQATGRMFIADVGQDRWEEIDLGVKGGDYGWSYRESLHNGPRMRSKADGVTFIDPIYEYAHGMSSDFTGNSISGGYVYRGTRLTELYGDYIFGDYVSKRIWALREKDGKWTPRLLATNVGNVAFGSDPATSDILIADYAGGRIRRLVRTGTTGPQPPALLSQVGAFKDLKTLEPAEGLVPYQPNVTFWSDYAVKQRWFTLPNGGDTIGFNPTGNWTFPTGMVWVKHFDMEMKRGDASTRKRLETRFIVKTANGVYGITYKWRPDNSDADLVPESGQDETLAIQLSDGTPHQQTWHYPGRAECLTCHTEVAGGALAFNTWQLNGNGTGKANQLDMLQHAGYFSAPIPAPATLGAFAPATDPNAPLEWRVRSYLAVNCVQCHQPGGVAQGTWDARPTTPTATANLVNGPLVNDRGDKTNRFAIPGDLVHSMALKRIDANGAPRMPPLATNELDPNAHKLLTEWINSLPK